MTMNEFLDSLSVYTDSFTPEQLEFYESLKNTKGKVITDKGIQILNCMKDNQEKYLNVFSAKQLGELLFLPPRSVSGALKKLVADGFAEKKSLSPVTYGITAKGMELKLD